MRVRQWSVSVVSALVVATAFAAGPSCTNGKPDPTPGQNSTLCVYNQEKEKAADSASVSVDPTSVELAPGSQKEFTLTLFNAGAGAVLTSSTFTASGGTFANGGVGAVVDGKLGTSTYTAPQTPGTYTVTVSSTVKLPDGSSGPCPVVSTTVTVVAPPDAAAPDSSTVTPPGLDGGKDAGPPVHKVTPAVYKYFVLYNSPDVHGAIHLKDAQGHEHVIVSGTGSQWFVDVDLDGSMNQFTAPATETQRGTLSASAARAAGGFLAAGTENLPGQGSTAYPSVAAYDATRTQLWSKVIGNTSGNASAVAELANGDIAVAYGDQPGGTGFDVAVARLDSTGNLLWAAAYGGSNDESPKAIYPLPGGDLLVAGATKSFGAGGSDVWALRLSGTDGSIVWQRAYGGAFDEGVQGVQIAPADAGNLWLGTSSLSLGSNTKADALFLKVSGTDGSLLAQKAYGSPNTDDTLGSLAATGSDLVFSLGAAYSSPYHVALVAGKTDTALAPSWTKLMTGGASTYWDGLFAGPVDGGFAFVGASHSSGVVVVTDANGQTGSDCGTSGFTSSDAPAEFVWSTPSLASSTTSATKVARTPTLTTLSASPTTNTAAASLQTYCK